MPTEWLGFMYGVCRLRLVVIMIIRSSVFSSAIGVLLARQHSAPGLFSSFGVLRVIKGFEEDLETYPRAVGFYYRLGVLHSNRLLRHHP